MFPETIHFNVSISISMKIENVNENGPLLQ